MTPGRPKEFQREEALERALDTFWSNGFAATGVAELTAAMGIGRQSLYDTFGDKRSLFLEALDAYCGRQFGVVQERLGSIPAPGDRLRALFDMLPEFMEGPMSKGCMVVNSMNEFCGSEDQEILAELQQYQERKQQMVRGLLQDAIEAGELDSELDADALTETIHVVMAGLSIQARMGTPSDTVRTAKTVVQALKSMLGL